MFKTLFTKQIFDADKPSPDVRFAVLQREEQLPFAPYPGHEIFWGTEHPQKLVTVTWSVNESRFSCKVEDEFPDDLGLDGRDFDELVEDAKASGWTLVRTYEAK